MYWLLFLCVRFLVGPCTSLRLLGPTVCKLFFGRIINKCSQKLSEGPSKFVWQYIIPQCIREKSCLIFLKKVCFKRTTYQIMFERLNRKEKWCLHYQPKKVWSQMVSSLTHGNAYQQKATFGSPSRSFYTLGEDCTLMYRCHTGIKVGRLYPRTKHLEYTW